MSDVLEADLTGSAWLCAVIRHYRAGVTALVAAEHLLGLCHPAEIAGSIRRRGRKVGNVVLAAVTPQEVTAAMEQLEADGFLEQTFEFASPVDDDYLEMVLELRIPTCVV